MDDQPTDGLTHEQRGQLAEWLAERNARMAALGHTPPPEGTLNERLHAMDAAFEASPDRDDEKVQENHELRRTVAILEEAIRALLNGQLPLPGSAPQD
ncbi:hypothetical protein [Streptomyces sennicomposti]